MERPADRPDAQSYSALGRNDAEDADFTTRRTVSTGKRSGSKMPVPVHELPEETALAVVFKRLDADQEQELKADAVAAAAATRCAAFGGPELDSTSYQNFEEFVLGWCKKFYDCGFKEIAIAERTPQTSDRITVILDWGRTGVRARLSRLPPAPRFLIETLPWGEPSLSGSRERDLIRLP